MTSDRWIWHGGGLSSARQHFGGEDWIDLSTGINPSPWQGINQCDIDWHRLPEEQDLAELEAIAASHFGCAPAHVCAVPGTEIVMRLIGTHLPQPFYHLSHSYRTHGAIGHNSQMVKTDALSQTITSFTHGTLTLANPNNPDGRILTPQILQHHLAHIEPNGFLIIDEAYAECSPEFSMVSQISDHRNLIVLRSFGKFFGLAGLRLGFVLGPRSLLQRIRETLGAWPVSSAAISIGKAAYCDQAWIDGTRTKLKLQCETMDHLLRAHGLQVSGHSPLFRLIDHPNAGALFQHLAKHQILTRPFDYADNWLRIGLANNAEHLARLDEALRHSWSDV